jgi:hypothetical protein
MLRFKNFIKEEYHSLMKNPITGKHHTVFVNPNAGEIRELAKETNNVRFISHNRNFYLFHGENLHAHVKTHLGLNLTNDPPIEKAFFGIAKPNADGTLSYSDSNQTIKDPAKIVQHHGHIFKYFAQDKK